MSTFEKAVLENLVEIVRLRRSEPAYIIVPIRSWAEDNAICLIYEVPPQPGLHGLWRSLTPDPGFGRPRVLAEASNWAYDFALADLWTRYHPMMPMDLVARAKIDWFGDIRYDLPDTLPPSEGGACKRFD